jgi:phospholipid N-methyltransferase
LNTISKIYYVLGGLGKNILTKGVKNTKIQFYEMNKNILKILGLPLNIFQN